MSCPKNIMISHLNINSVRYQFHELSDLFNRSLVDILFISETKLDQTFKQAPFEVTGFKSFRKDRSPHGGEYWRMGGLICPAVAVQTLNRQSSKALSSIRQSVIGSGRLCVLIDPHHYQTIFSLMILPCVWITCM